MHHPAGVVEKELHHFNFAAHVPVFPPPPPWYNTYINITSFRKISLLLKLFINLLTTLLLTHSLSNLYKML